MTNSLTLLTILLSAAGGVSGCSSGKSEGMDPPTMVGIEVSPRGVVLDTLGGQDFRARSLFSDGTAGAIGVTWSTTGGTISPTGIYLPPQAEGLYLVIATQQDGSFADTALVTVTNDPPPNPLYPHEPAGFIKQVERPFDQLTETGWHISAASGSIANFTIQTDSFAPFTPPHVGQVLFPKNFEGGGEPVNVGADGFPSNPTQIYLSFWVRFSINWDGHPSGVNKIFHIWSVTPRGNIVYLSAEGGGSGPLSPEVHLQNVVSFNGFKNLTPNLRPSTQVTRGRWQRWEVLLRSNTPGSADGTAEWWIDGAKVGSYSGIAYVAALESPVWMQLNWAPTWGGNTGVFLPAAQTQQIDHIYVSGAQ